MANLILASKREVKSGAQMWHAYLQENGTKNAESDFYFSEPMKCLRYMFLLRKRSGGIIPKAIYTKARHKPSRAQRRRAHPKPSKPQSRARTQRLMRA